MILDAMDGFMLRKSYLDVVDTDGRCAMAYWTELRWGPLAVRWDELSVREAGRPAVHRSAWNERDALGIRVSCQPWCPAFSRRLLDTPFGTLDWSCDAPGGDVAVEYDDGTAVRGAGYREHLVLAMLPWKLPIDELRWGRWLSAEDRQSIVWIAWRGDWPLTLVIENGTTREPAEVRGESIHCRGEVLRLAAGDALYSRTLAEMLGGAKGLVNRLPASWRVLEDRKVLCRGTFGAASGWAIHELVRLP